jgi:hypothetical protein
MVIRSPSMVANCLPASFYKGVDKEVHSQNEGRGEM